MSRMKTISTLFILTLCLLPSCRRKEMEEQNTGTVENTVYQNDFLGLRVEIPQEWSIQDQKSRRRMMNMGSDMIAGDDTNLKEALEAAEVPTLYLFAAFRHPLGAPVPYNQNVLCLAEQISHLPGIQKGSDYLFHTKRLLNSSRIDVVFPRDIYTEDLGGRQFYVMPIQMQAGGITVHQNYYAAIINGHALAFITSYINEEQKSSVEKILTTIRCT
ncbi:MAG: hypothetical protein ACQEQ4_00145 [Fibrobacterota bacterium]